MENNSVVVHTGATYPASRYARMTAEIKHTVAQMPDGAMTAWGLYTAKVFGKVTWRRGKNFALFVGKLVTGVAKEVNGFAQAHAQGEAAFKAHTEKRSTVWAESTLKFSGNVLATVNSLIAAVRQKPAENAPKLIVATIAALVSSGGMDGDGGVPDLDLMAGIDAHRSIFTHSIIAGAAIEAGLLATAALIEQAYQYLPEDHDPLWDSIAKHKDDYVLAASQGASLGIAYHLLIDSTVDAGTYHGLPVPMPTEAHIALTASNAVAEGLDVKNKDALHGKN